MFLYSPDSFECFVLQLGLISSYAVWAVSRSFTMFLLFRIIGGICKGNVSLCSAIVADLPCPKARNRGMVCKTLYCGKKGKTACYYRYKNHYEKHMTEEEES